jgi:hypothetical protein
VSVRRKMGAEGSNTAQLVEVELQRFTEDEQRDKRMAERAAKIKQESSEFRKAYMQMKISLTVKHLNLSFKSWLMVSISVVQQRGSVENVWLPEGRTQKRSHRFGVIRILPGHYSLWSTFCISAVLR